MGANSMNNLIDILIRWTMRRWAFRSDIRKMYNAVLLVESQYQLYLWHENLDPNEQPKIKVIKTLIYGVRSSGNQAERALRVTVEKCRHLYPKAFDVITNDTYVDDCMSGTDSEDEGHLTMDEVQLSVGMGGFSII